MFFMWEWNDKGWKEIIINTINKLIKILYEDLDNPAGGPLHIITDDGNYRDHDLDFCEKQCYENSNGDYDEATI